MRDSFLGDAALSSAGSLGRGRERGSLTVRLHGPPAPAPWLFPLLNLHLVSSAGDVERARILKEEGNELVKKGNHKKAIEKYSESLSFSDIESATYSNRYVPRSCCPGGSRDAGCRPPPPAPVCLRTGVASSFLSWTQCVAPQNRCTWLFWSPGGRCGQWHSLS